MHDTVFLVVWAATFVLFLRERKARKSADAQILELSGRVARVASEAANANAEMVAAQAPIVAHHELLLNYLRQNDGKSIDEAKTALNDLFAGVKNAGAHLKLLAISTSEHAPNLESPIERASPGHYHRTMLAWLKMNQGKSVADFEKMVSNGG